MKIDARTFAAYALIAALPFGFYYIPFFLDGAYHLDAATLAWLTHLPGFALLLAGLLGWRLNQTRILYSCLLLFYFYLLAEQPSSAMTLGMKEADLTQAMAIALPFSLMLIYSLREAPLLSQRSLLRLLLACLPAFFLAGLFGGDKASFAGLAAWQGFAGANTLLSRAVPVGLALFTVFAFVHPDDKVRPFMEAIAVALWPVLLSSESALGRRILHPESHVTVVTLCFISASGILLWAIFAMYWHRVYLDELTGIPNRRALDEKLATLDGDYSLAMVDIDHFKKFNDTYGHEEGDNVLRLVARHLMDGSAGRAYRYGGEEFCMVFEGWGSQRAEGHCDEIRAALAGRDFSIRLPEKIRKKTSAEDRGSLHAKSANAKVTVSMGVAMPDKSRVYPHEVIKLADQGLYDAKEKGRNCVVRKN